MTMTTSRFSLGLALLAALGTSIPINATAFAQLVPLSTGRAVSAPSQDSAKIAVGAPPSASQATASCTSRPDWRHRRVAAGTVTETLRKARAYFNSDGLQVAGGLGVTTSSTATLVYSELVSDLIRLGGPLGYAKVGFGAMLVDEKKTETPAEAPAAESATNNGTALDRLRLGGGNAVMFLALPFLHYESRSGGCSTSRFDLLWLPRFAADVPKFDGATDVQTGVADIGMEAQWVAVTVGQTMKFYGTVRGAYARGSKSYFTALELPAGTKDFWYARWEMGIDIAGRLRISGARISAGPRQLIRGPVVAQVQLLN